MIEIENMRWNPGRGVAVFDAHFDGGWTVRQCVIVTRDDGSLAALPPLVRDGVRAVQIPDRYWFDFINASLAAYDDFRSWRVDAGVREVLGPAERESLGAAGLIEQHGT